jgi:hypothetical protein
MVSPKTIHRLQLISEKTRAWNDKERDMPHSLRDELSMMVASTFSDFAEFAEIGMRLLGYSITEMQLDIARYMADKSYGRKKMVQAQRGEAKSTLAALYAVWCLIQDPQCRVLVVSGGESQASDVAILIIRIIQQWHLLCWLRPDPSKGDRKSYEKYDVHFDLKGLEKSASVSCEGITAALQGKRADVLVADDIETAKNSMTQTMRDTLLHLSKDFAAINTHGETLYLGTPQTKDSIYKSLPQRGYHVRIWPGRYPNAEELIRYRTGTLAPTILDALELDPTLGTGCGLDATRGQPTDLGRYDEDALVEKELEFGPEGFGLQFMLDTTLSDALRTRIRLTDLIVGDYGSEVAPETVHWSSETRCVLKDLPPSLEHYTLYKPAASSDSYMDYQHKVMIIDPAGAGGDEVAFAVGGVTNSYIHLMTVGGLRGGMTEANMDTILDVAVEFGVTDIKIEANMGHGVVSSLMVGHCEKRGITDMGFEDFYAKGQKERRIIDTISPVTRRHKFVVHRRALEDDHKYCMLHPIEKRTVMSCFYQLANITYDRNSLAKDDRADAVQGIVMFLSKLLAVDDAKEATKRKDAASVDFIDNPMGYVKKSMQGGSKAAPYNTNRNQLNSAFRKHRN